MATSEPACASGHGVLLVENHDDLRHSMVLILEREGYAVTGAGDGAGALVALEGMVAPCVMLLDMPIMNGAELLGRLAIHPRFSTLPVIAISSGAAQAPWARRMLRRPFDSQTLLTAVAEFCPPPTRHPA